MLINVNNEIKELNYVVNGIDDANDLIGNVITLEHDDEGHAIMDQDTFDWWENYIELAQADEEKKAEMIETYGSDIVEDAINKAFEGINDYGDHHRAYQEAFAEVEASEVVLVAEYDDSAIYALKGSAEGSKAVRITWGYSTGRELGLHSFCESWAVAELGSLDTDMDFVPDCYTEDDMHKTIQSKSAIGIPKSYAGYNAFGDVDWDDFYRWSKMTSKNFIAE